MGRTCRALSVGAALFVLCGLTACVHLPAPTGVDAPPTVHLPLDAAHDGRARFASLFARELTARGQGADVQPWLHGASLVAASSASGPIPKAASTSVLIVNGIFGDCVDDQSLPFSDGITRAPPANYTQGYPQFASLGFGAMRALRVDGRASSAANAVTIAQEITEEARRPGVMRIVIVAYSKGVPDTLEALERLRSAGTLPAQVQALVSLSGVVMGTPIADSGERLYEALATHIQPLRCGPSRGGEIDSLTVRERVKWLAAHPLPAQIRTFSVVARTDPATVAPGLRPFHLALNRIDPNNDGQVIASSSILPRAELLADVRSDHWRYVMPLDKHPSRFVRAVASDAPFPRDAFFGALLWAVMGRLDESSEATPRVSSHR